MPQIEPEGTFTRANSSQLTPPKTTYIDHLADQWVALTLQHPCLLLTLIYAISLLMAVLVLPNFDLSAPDVGMRIRDHEIALQSDAWLTAMIDYVGGGTDRTAPPQSQSTFVLEIYYKARNPAENVFDEEVIQRIRQVEEVILTDPDYNTFCYKDLSTRQCVLHKSIINEFYETNAEGERGAVLRDINATLHEMMGVNERDTNEFFFDRGFGLPDRPVSTVTRSRFQFGLPLEGYKNRDDAFEDQFREFQSWIIKFHDFLSEEASNENVEVLYEGDGIYMCVDVCVLEECVI